MLAVPGVGGGSEDPTSALRVANAFGRSSGQKGTCQGIMPQELRSPFAQLANGRPIDFNRIRHLRLNVEDLELIAGESIAKEFLI